MSLLNCNCRCRIEDAEGEKCEIFNCSKEDLIRSGFYFGKSHSYVVCCACGWEYPDREMPMNYINFIHSAQRPNCAMVKLIPRSCKRLGDDITSVKDIEHLLVQTFLSWPKPYPKITDLVMSGFFYTGIEDAVTCVCCNLTLEDWQPQDDPAQEHKKFKPDCKLLTS